MQHTISGCMFSWFLDISFTQPFGMWCREVLVASNATHFLDCWISECFAVWNALPRQGCPCRYCVITICVGRISSQGTWFLVDEGTVLELELHMSFTTCHDIVMVEGTTWVLGLWRCLQCLNISSIFWTYSVDERRIYMKVSFFQLFSYLFRYTV